MTDRLKVGYFPGCSLASGSVDYSESVQATSAAARVDLVEVPDWNCCGATSAHSVNKMLSLSLPARNLALAREAGLEMLVVPCAGCYNRLASVHHALTSDRNTLAQVEEIIERPYDGKLRIMNVIEYASEILLPRIGVKADALAGARFAPYYGCLLVRPPKVLAFDDPEDPTSMDVVLRGLGAGVVDWEYKVECCGGGHSLSRTDLVLPLASKILTAARESRADAIVVACPMCHTNLDLRQLDVKRVERLKDSMPVYYLTEVIGLAAGLDEKALGVRRHLINATGLRAKLASRKSSPSPAKAEAKA
jgi:heterodisulfide reductase subunit B